MKQWMAVCCVLAAGAAQAGPKIEHWVAPSGAKVFFVASPSLPMLDVSVDFAAGGVFSPADKAGVAGLVCGLLDTGAGDLDEEAIADVKADTAASLSGGAESDGASLMLRTLTNPQQLEPALALLKKVLQQPTFPEAVLKREKARVIAGIKEADTQPGAILSKRFSAALYPDHPYGQSATVESISRITREDLVAFYRANYCASRAVVSIVGDVDRAGAERIAAQLTDGLPTGCTAREIPAPAKPAGAVLRIDHPSQQSHIAIGLPALRRGEADFYPLVVGNYVLGGGGFVSRMLKEVREKRGYAYSAASYFTPMKVEGPFQIGLQTKADQTDAALKVARETLDTFLAQGPTEEELVAAKRNIVNGFVLRLDSNRKLLDQIMLIGFYGLPLDYLDQYPQKVEAVTAKQIREAFRARIQPDHLVTVIVGPAAPKP